jgi:hypothetical protein
MLSLSLGSLIDECDWIEEREVIMEIMKFQKFKDHLLKKGMLTLLFNIEEEYMEMHFHIYSVTEDLILGDLRKDIDWRILPMGQRLSTVFTSEKGVFGLHSSCDGVMMGEDGIERLKIIPEDKVWRIERRQFPRMMVKKNVLWDIAKHLGEYFEPQHQVHKAFLLNLCKTGVALQCNENIGVGEYLYLLLNLDEEVSTDNLCVIVWGVEISSKEANFRFSYGLRFLNPKSKVLDTIENFVSEKILLQF